MPSTSTVPPESNAPWPTFRLSPQPEKHEERQPSKTGTLALPGPSAQVVVTQLPPEPAPTIVVPQQPVVPQPAKKIEEAHSVSYGKMISGFFSAIFAKIAAVWNRIFFGTVVNAAKPQIQKGAPQLSAEAKLKEADELLWSKLEEVGKKLGNESELTLRLLSIYAQFGQVMHQRK